MAAHSPWTSASRMSRDVDRPLAPSPKIKGYGSVSRDDTRWDYVMVFPNPPKETIEAGDQRDEIIRRLRTAGLETKLFYSVGGELVFCKIRAPEELLKDEAESTRMHLQLDPDELRKASAEGIPSHNIAPFPIRDVKRQYSYTPFEYIFAAYMQHKEAQKFFMKKGKYGSLFGSTERLALIEHIITDHGDGAGCDIERLIYDGVIVECFPLHEDDQKMDLKEQWIKWNTSPMNQPFDRICNYFGVKVSLYFLYLGHYTKWLLYPALVGLIPGFLDYLVPRLQHKAVFSYLSPAFGAFMTIWMTVYLEDWKRLNARETLRWGTSSFTQIVQLRPQFQGEKIPSPINGRPTRYFSPREKFKRVAYSWIVISFLILVVFALVFAIFVLRYDLTKGDAADNLVVYHIQLGPMVAATANVVQITIMTKIYGIVSIFLNDQENHRTDIEYENSLIIKTVIFQFVNNYTGLFYVAFLKDSIEGCTISCMYELEYTVAIVYCSRLFIGNMTEVAIPRFWVYVNQYRLIGKLTGAADPALEARKSAAERELFMSQYDWRGTFDDYTEMALQFGYTTMFVVSFPFAPLLSYLNNYFEIRLDAYRLIFESRRPRPYNVRDIGYWYQVLQAMAAISICTNGGVVIFTGNYFNGVSVAMRVWYFTLFTGSMFFFKYLLEVCINDTPESVVAQRKRAEFLISKCLYHVPDEDTFRPVLDGEDVESQDDGLVIHDEDIHDLEAVTERLGHITVREDYDIVGKSVASYRLLSTQFGVDVEMNLALFAQYFESHALLNSAPCSVVTADSVDEDELNPFSPAERVRKDVTNAIALTPHWRKKRRSIDADAGGSEDSEGEDQELVVVMARAKFLKLCHNGSRIRAKRCSLARTFGSNGFDPNGRSDGFKQGNRLSTWCTEILVHVEQYRKRKL